MDEPPPRTSPARRLPAATIVVPVRDGARVLARTMRAAAAQEGVRARVLVVDNGSTDGSAEIASGLGATVLRCRRRGPAAAREMGWRRARTPWIAFLDADCEPPRDWLARAIARLRLDARLAAVGVRLVDAPPQTLAERHIAEQRLLDTDFFWQGSALHFPFLVTAGLVCRRAALRDAGGFDLSFGAATGEDADLCWRLQEFGWRIEYDPSIQIVHHHRATIPAMLRQARWYGRGSAEVFARWRRRLGWRRFTDRGPWRRLGRGLLRAPLALATGRDAYERARPALEAADAAAFLAGKLGGAIRWRMWYF